MIDVTQSVIYGGKGLPETRLKAYGHALAALGHARPDVLCLSADLTSQTEADLFRGEHPGRFFSMGMAEQNMVGVAAGLARAGEIPFAHSFACFITRRCFDQIAMSVAYPRLNVKLVGMMPGISSPGGASHQAIDDLAMMRATPNMRILDIGEASEAEQAPELAAAADGPVYLRLRRGLLPAMFDGSAYRLQWGESYLLRRGADVALVTSGLMTERALQAAALLEENGIGTTVLHVPSIKPLDEEGIAAVASSCRAVLTLDNHSVIGGLGSAVSEVLAERRIAVSFRRLGLRDVFGKAASNAYIFRHFELDPDQIARAALELLEHGTELRGAGNWSQAGSGDSGWGEAWKQGGDGRAQGR
ncbi:transketolase family protein [Paenibacillus sacheonensis]|uniref:Transketolase n=1 Tax=Paenibacillus sacheonensis TaxID=742054 RepID=A0A7X5C0X9_9BACL|nr:transketolase C-terminal domain-containing protein [Paenibacillus sacheonensis]MBM7568361.1 transketolase [Paenibacillus sacheonensis]NBC72061.1 transketolase [Paenibacillus sacheonensis]